MRTSGKFVLAMMGAATLFVALAQPAEARRRIRFGSFGGFGSSGYAEKIDKVYDLPDNGTYFHDGKYYDLGAFYQVRDGAEIYPAEPSFVLYNGDRYVKLDGAQLTMLTVELGMDPTATYRANYASKSVALPRPKSANEIERLPGETNAQLRARVRAMGHDGSAGAAAANAGSSTAAQVGAGWLGAFFLPMLMIGGLFVFGLRKFLRKRVAAVIASGDEAPVEVNATSFDQRIAARLRELEGGQSGMLVEPAMASPAPRTFGRKLA